MKLVIFSPEACLSVAKRVMEKRKMAEWAWRYGTQTQFMVFVHLSHYYEKAIRDYANRILRGEV